MLILNRGCLINLRRVLMRKRLKCLFLVMFMTIVFCSISLNVSAEENSQLLNPNSELKGVLIGQQTLWLKVPLTADGDLSVTLNTSGPNVQLMLATTEKNEIVRNDNWGKEITLNAKGLQPGGYYIKLYMYGFPNESCNFTVSNSFTPASLVNDDASNDTPAQAIETSLNNSVTGHIGYSGGLASSPADVMDWWKLRTAKNGNLSISIEHVLPVNLQLALYNEDGSKEIGRMDTWGKSTPLEFKDLKAGTYLVRVFKYAWNFTPYTLSNTFTPSSLSIELQINNPYMTVNGVKKEIDPGKGTKPVIYNGRTILPIRALVEELGGTLSWNGNEQKVTITLDSKTIELWIGKKSTKINGVEKTTDVVPRIVNSRTMLPLRYVIDNLGYNVQWVGSTQKITVTS
jgi:hypothetical protein